MKLASSLVFAAAMGTAMAQFSTSQSADSKREDCEDCIEDLDEAKECLRTCNNLAFNPNGSSLGLTALQNANLLAAGGSLLNDCLDPSRSDSVESLDSLIDCCEMTKDCEDTLEDAQECVQNCFDPCIKEKSELYLECIEDESKFGSSKCDRQSCLDGFLDDLEDDADFSGSGDILDLKNVEKRIKKLDEDDIQDCELLEDFVEATCEIGDDCCEECTTELSYVVDCLINDIVVPFVAIELNTTVDECPINEDCELDFPSGSKSNKSRKLKASKVGKDEEHLFNKALGLRKKSKQTRRDARKEAAIKASDRKRVLEAVAPAVDAIEACQKAMEMNTIAHNISYAATGYMQCVSSEAIARLPEESGTTDGSGANTFGVAALVAALAGSFFLL